MQRARAAILAGGGADAVNSFTRFYLALLGPDSVRSLPERAAGIFAVAEMVSGQLVFDQLLVADDSGAAVDHVGLSSRCAQIEPERGIRELFLSNPLEWPYPRCPGLKQSRRIGELGPVFPLHRQAVQISAATSDYAAATDGRASRRRDWMIDRFAGSDGLGAIFPPMIWSIVALRSLGYADDSAGNEVLPRAVVGPGDRRRRNGPFAAVQIARVGYGPHACEPCPTAVWMVRIRRSSAACSGSWLRKFAPAAIGRTTSTRRRAAGASSLPIGFIPIWTIRRWCRWPCSEACRTTQRRIEHAAAELAIDHGIDGAATCPMPGARRWCSTTSPAATERARHWMLAMQNRDGGWAAFDRDNTAEFLCHVPFADHNAMIDPSSPDLAARVLESLASLGKRHRRSGGRSRRRVFASHARSRRQLVRPLGRELHLRHLASAERPGGRWHAERRSDDGGRRAIGSSAHQQPSGGWGESADSYADPKLRGQGRETASQTAWALLGLIAAGMHDHPAAARGVQLSARASEHRRHLGRNRIHRHRFPARVLFALPLLPHLLPADGPVALGEGDGES